MDFIIDAIVEWLKGLLVDGIIQRINNTHFAIFTIKGEFKLCQQSH